MTVKATKSAGLRKSIVEQNPAETNCDSADD